MITARSVGSVQRMEERELPDVKEVSEGRKYENFQKCWKFTKDGSVRTASSVGGVPTLWLHADHKALGEPAGWAPVPRRLLHGAVSSSRCGKEVS